MSRSRPPRAATPRPRATAARPTSSERRALLDVASRVLATEGPTALSMRRLATEAGVSTMVLYTRFGSRDALMEQLLLEGFTRFGAELAAVSERDPFEQLAALGHAYRRFARQNPTYFPLMWAARQVRRAGEALPAKVPSPALQQASQRSFGALAQTVTRVLAALDRPARDVEPLALSVWATVHGFVSLEMAGVISPAAADGAYAQTLAFIEHGFRHAST